MSRILVTGASGFVGQALLRELVAAGHEVNAAVRNQQAALNVANQARSVITGEISEETDWGEAVQGCESVIHLAARVHVMKEKAEDPLEAFRRVNVRGTGQLAQAALKAGVKRFIYLSSIKVNGEQTQVVPFAHDDTPAPGDAYAQSKSEAEVLLREFEGKGLETVIVRSPLVYGPGVKGNFLALMKWVAQGIPLPLACIENSRSLVYVGNLVDALMVCVTHEQAAGETFLISDQHDFSTPDLICELARTIGRRPRLFCVSPFVLQFIARLAGRSDEAQRLLSSLVVDTSRLTDILQWRPPYTAQTGLRATAEWFLSSRRNPAS